MKVNQRRGTGGAYRAKFDQKKQDGFIGVNHEFSVALFVYPQSWMKSRRQHYLRLSDGSNSSKIFPTCSSGLSCKIGTTKWVSGRKDP